MTDTRMISLGQATLLRIIDENPDRAFGRDIAKIWREQTGKNVAMSHVYQTMYRLRGRRLVEELEMKHMGGRGAYVKFYRLTEEGKKVLEIVNRIAKAIGGDLKAAADGRTELNIGDGK